MINFIEYPNELSRINTAAASPEAFISNTENAYYQNILDIAQNIAEDNNGCKLVMLFGPSSSGKTTTSHLLETAFHDIGIGSTIISLDDFYRGERQAPLLPNGQHDYESIDALNVPEIETCLLNLVEKNRCDMPVFNFDIRMPYPHRRHVILKEQDIAIVEGIHALNPVVTNQLPADKFKKIYISVKQGIMDGETELFSATRMRLLRRIVRDYNFRGTKPERTLSMWPAVMEGERKYIMPYRSEVDYTINSLHLYEVCVLKNQAIPLLQSVSPASDHYNLAQKLIHNLSEFEPISSEFVPKRSIIREFIGGGIY